MRDCLFSYGKILTFSLRFRLRFRAVFFLYTAISFHRRAVQAADFTFPVNFALTFGSAILHLFEERFVVGGTVSDFNVPQQLFSLPRSSAICLIPSCIQGDSVGLREQFFDLTRSDLLLVSTIFPWGSPSHTRILCGTIQKANRVRFTFVSQ